MKKVKTLKTAHTANSKKGMGDFYGSGVKNPMGKMKSDFGLGKGPSARKTKTPPKSLA